MFQPPRCPYHGCAFHNPPRKGVHWFLRTGHYRPLCRSQPVPRFRCLGCRRSFSRQSFRMDYRDHRPHLNRKLLELVASGTGLRKSARLLRMSNRCLELKLRKLAAASSSEKGSSSDPSSGTAGELLGYSAVATVQRAARARRALATHRAGGFLACRQPPLKRARGWPLRKLDSAPAGGRIATGMPGRSRNSIGVGSARRAGGDRERRPIESPCGVRCHAARPASSRQPPQARTDAKHAVGRAPRLRPRERFAYKDAARGTAAQPAGSR